MQQPRCYVFRGNATGVAAHIRRPVDMLLPVQALSSLPVNGGLSESKVGPLRWGDRPPGTRVGLGAGADTYVTFDSAATSARGDFIDSQQAVDLTHGKLRVYDVATQTRVTSIVENLVVIGRVAVGEASMMLEATSNGFDEPSIRTGATLTGVAVDGYGVDVALDLDFFNANDTMAKLSLAAGEGQNPQLFVDAGSAACYGFLNPTLTVKATLVTKMSWSGDPHPEATIDGNSIIIPDYGRVFFGEMYVGPGSRRLTMARFQLGSDDGGDASGAGGDTNGSQWPPTGP